MSDSLEQSFDNDFTLTVQKKFLSLMIYDPSWTKISGLDVIKPEYFENHYLQNICKWIRDYTKKYKTVPTKLVLLEKAKDLVNNKTLNQKEYYLYTDTIDEIFTIEDSDDYEYFKLKAVNFARTAAWKQALYNATSALTITNYEDALTKFNEVLKIGMENDLGIDYANQNPEESLRLLNDDYDPMNMIKTGIESWDKALGGGFTRNNIHIIGACPGGGKSRIMAFLTKKAMENGKKVIFITLELSQVETEANINSAVTGLTLHDMLKPENREDFLRKRNMFLNTFGGEVMIKFYRPGSINTDTIHNYIRKVMNDKKENFGIEWKPDFIIVDYLDKLLPVQKIRANSYEDMGAVANDLKNLAISFNCPVLTGSQLGKYSWNIKGDDVISMDSIAESAQKVHLAHSMTTINFNPGEKALGRARLFLAKSRSGIPGSVIWIENNLGKCYIHEIDRWDPKEVEAQAGFSIKSNDSKKK